jgi:hypothetical protein
MALDEMHVPGAREDVAPGPLGHEAEPGRLAGPDPLQRNGVSAPHGVLLRQPQRYLRLRVGIGQHEAVTVRLRSIAQADRDGPAGGHDERHASTPVAIEVREQCPARHLCEPEVLIPIGRDLDIRALVGGVVLDPAWDERLSGLRAAEGHADGENNESTCS